MNPQLASGTKEKYSIPTPGIGLFSLQGGSVNYKLLKTDLHDSNWGGTEVLKISPFVVVHLHTCGVANSGKVVQVKSF